MTDFDLNDIINIQTKRGIEKSREEIAQNMLRNGFSCEQTAELSGLDIERIKEVTRSWFFIQIPEKISV